MDVEQPVNIEIDVFSAFMVEDYESGLFEENNFLFSSEDLSKDG